MSERRIVWDNRKNRANLSKQEASDIFFDPLALTVDDPAHSLYEFRFVSIGKSKTHKLIVVFYTENEAEVRIISARKPTRIERLNYEEER